MITAIHVMDFKILFFILYLLASDELKESSQFLSHIELNINHCLDVINGMDYLSLFQVIDPECDFEFLFLHRADVRIYSWLPVLTILPFHNTG